MGCERLQPILSQNVYKYACHYRIYQQATSVNGLLLLESSCRATSNGLYGLFTHAEKVSLELLSYGSFDDDTRRQDSRRVE